MAPTLSLPLDDAQTSHTFKASTSSDTTTNAVFGSCAIVIGVLTVWQGRRVWKLWHVGPHNNHDSHGVQAHQLSDQGASTPSHEVSPPQQRPEDVENISPSEDNPTLFDGQTPQPGGTNMESCPANDASTTTTRAESRETVDEGSKLADPAIDDADTTLRKDHPSAHSIDQKVPPSRQATQSPRQGPLGRRYSAPGATS